MKDRIRLVMEQSKMTQQDFAEYLDISPASLSSIFTGRTNPTNNHVSAIHSAFPEISINWLMFGEGEQMVSDEGKGLLESSDFTVEESKEKNLKSANVTDARSSNFAERKGVDNGAKEGYLDVRSSVAPSKAKIKEIRVFYDDNTFEVFVPSK